MLMWFALEQAGHDTCTVRICVSVAAGCVRCKKMSSDGAGVVCCITISVVGLSGVGLSGVVSVVSSVSAAFWSGLVSFVFSD